MLFSRLSLPLTFSIAFIAVSLTCQMAQVQAREPSGKVLSVSAKAQHKNKPNHLLNAASPYLQQHAYNPIDWYPWGEEAFAKAKRENKPIFLSVGYSTCHWCHVMEEESFSQQDIGALLNKYFVAIKVDRERRPDLDEYYMMATQIITGTGGWPNNLFLTPDQKPFFAVGYLPKDQFSSLLAAVNGQWQSKNRKELFKDGDRLSKQIQKVMNRQEQARNIDERAIKKAARMILKSLDPFYGGFSSGPKFPEEPKLMFLSRMALQYGDKKSLDALKQTVDAILDGGIHDHVGGGFHRYAIDNAWLVPHFEKMLYNQAQMVRVLVRLYELTGKPRYKQAAERTLDFVLRDMTSPDGRFYAAFDADSKGGEGRYYTWSIDEVRALAGVNTDFAIDILGLTKEGNFEGRNIIHLPYGLKEQVDKLVKHFSTTEKNVKQSVDLDLQVTLLKQRILDDLRTARDKRKKPHLDRKIIASWNGMMITAFAEAARVFESPRYLKAGDKAFNALFSRQVLTIPFGNILVRSLFEGKGGIRGQLSDYAALAVAAASLSDAFGGDDDRGKEWEKTALFFINHANRLFFDEKNGRYFMTENRQLIKQDDSSVPSGNAMMLEALVMMTQRTDNEKVRQQAEKLIANMSGLMVKNPAGMTYALYGADLYLRGMKGDLVYGAKGHVKISTARQRVHKCGYFDVNIEIEKGWHINAFKPLEAFLIPTSLSVRKPSHYKISNLSFPKPILKSLGFNQNKLALYEKWLRIKGQIPFKAKRFMWGGYAISQRNFVLPLLLKYQACSDKICLPPEEALLTTRMIGGCLSSKALIKGRVEGKEQ